MEQPPSSSVPPVTPEAGAGTSSAPSSNPNPLKKEADTTDALVVGGLGLIFVSVAVMVLSSWSSLGPWSKTMLAAVPMVVLYLLTLMFKRPEQRETNELLFGSATLLIGVTAGTALYQFDFYDRLDASLIVMASFIGWLGSFILELLLKRSELAVTSLAFIFLGVAAWLGNYVVDADNAATIWGAGIVLTGLGLMGSGWLWRARSSESGGRRIVFGWLLATLGGAVLLPSIFSEVMEVEGNGIYLTNLLLVPWMAWTARWRQIKSADYFTTKQSEVGFASLELIPVVLAASVYFGLVDLPGTWIGYLYALIGYLVTLLAWRWPMKSAVIVGPLMIAYGLLIQVGDSSGQAALVATIGLIIIASTSLFHATMLNVVGVLALVLGVFSALMQTFGSDLAGPVLATVLGVILIIAGSLAGRYKEWWRSSRGRQPLVDVSWPSASAPTNSSGSCGRIVLTLFIIYVIFIAFMRILASAFFSSF